MAKKNAGSGEVAPFVQWDEGINPWLEPYRRQLIIDSRNQRAKELEAWKPGAGKAYLEAGLTPFRK